MLNQYNYLPIRILITIIIILFFLLFAIHPFKWFLISQQMHLTPGSRLYNQWLQPTIPIPMQFYFFNLSNPLEFQSGGKPILQQLGPYTYHEKRFKVNVKHDAQNGTLEYNEIKQYYFNKTASIGDENDTITSVNLGFIGIASKLSSMPWIIDALIEIIEHHNNYSLFQTRTVKELLWGYKDDFLTLLSNYSISVPMTEIGILINKNNTPSDTILINNGVKNQNMLGKIIDFHGMQILPYWKSLTANMINGSDGTLFHPFIHKHEKLYAFAKEICRSVEFVFDSETEINNLPAYKYTLSEDTFKSAKTCEANKGFCLNWPNCFNDGVLDMSTCQPNAPVVVSQAHFFNADKSYQTAVDGIYPSDEFNTQFYIEPNTGVILNVQSKFQVNIILKKNKSIKQLSKIPDLLLLPLVYFNESANLNNSTIIELISVVVKGPMILEQVMICSIIITILILCSILLKPFIYMHRIFDFRSRKEEKQHLLS
ncbi:unnamed protein product [Trichobilharzia szidati]|nr:unnamed protein product [Trichobilharzia szidati]